MQAATKRRARVPAPELSVIDDRPAGERLALPLDGAIPYTLGELAAHVPHEPNPALSRKWGRR